MAEIAEINGIAVGNVSRVNGIVKSGITNLQGFTFPAGGTPTTFLTKVSDNWTATTHGLGRLPTSWRSVVGDTVFGSTNSDRPWTSYPGGRTSSNHTGPDDGHDSSRSDGQELNNDDYLYCETSGNNAGYPNKRFLARTPALDFTNALSNNTLQLEFWFHAFGATIGNFGVSATDNSTSAGDDTLGLHFTSDTAGGCTIVYWDDASDDGSSTASGVRITGQQQTQGDDDVGNDDRSHWRKATVDLNSVAGQSSVYLWFFHKGGSTYTGDFAIDDVVVTGEE